MIKKERRKFPRIDCKVKVLYKILTDEEKHMFLEFSDYVREAVSRNLSPEGLCIKTGRYLSPGSNLAVEIIFPEISEPVRALGRVIWSKDLESSGEFYSGIEFIAIKDRYFDEMSQLVANYFVEKYKIADDSDKKNLIQIFTQLFRQRKKS
ncbi:MAG: PilZ domain-containing protein [Elusimicrobiota bacterium]|nr:PilZ domain-containing protein [Elusimicrobiota bacterium]